MKVLLFTFSIFTSLSLLAQNIGINQSNPTNSLHISAINIGDNPLRVDGLQPYNIGDTALLVINQSTGIVKYINNSDFATLLSNSGTLGTDNQNIDSLILNGFNLETFITNGNSASVNLTPLADSIANSITQNLSFQEEIVSILFDNADTLLYNTELISNLRDSIDTDIDSMVLVGNTLFIYENGTSASVALNSLSDNDADPTNEIQTISKSGSTVTLSNGGGSFVDENTQLTEAQVDAFTNNNGYLTSFTEVDGSVTNEIELPTGGNNGQILSTNGTGTYTWVNDNSGTDNQNISGSSFNATSGNLVIGIQNGTNQTVNLNGLKDHDWYEVGGTTQPSSINNNIFTQGNVGIGLNNPTERLEITGGGIKINNNFGIGFSGETPQNSVPTGDKSRIYYDVSLFGPSLDGLVIEKTDGNAPNNPDGGIAFSHKGTNNVRTLDMVIRGNGNVGIGTTNPSRKMHISGSNTGVQKFKIEETSLGGESMSLGNGFQANTFAFSNTGDFWLGAVVNVDNNMLSSDADVSIIGSSGDVGIGTTTPSSRTHILSPSTMSSFPIGITAPGHVLRIQQGGNGSLFLDGNAMVTDVTTNLSIGTLLNAPILLGTNDQTRMTITGAGDVGIGIQNPNGKLQVVGGDAYFTDQPLNNFSTSRSAQAVVTDNFRAASDNGIRLYDGNSNSHIHMVSRTNGYFQSYNTSSIGPGILGSGSIDRGDNANFSNLILNPLGGNIGIRTSNPTATLTVNGTANKPGGGTWAATSDRRTKKDIVQFKDGLNVLKSINPVTFKYNGLYNTNNDGKDYVGIIAQEVEKVAPYMIGSYKASKTEYSNNKEEILNYDGGTYMLYILVNSVKEQQNQIKLLKEELKQEREINAKEIEALKQLIKKTN